MKANHIVIDVHHGSTSESWLVVYPDGRVKYHIENDGWRYVNRGAEEHDKWMTPEDVRKLGRSGMYPNNDPRTFTERVAEAVKKLNEVEELTDEEAEAIEEEEDPRGYYEK
jgi:hypothetical protein